MRMQEEGIIKKHHFLFLQHVLGFRSQCLAPGKSALQPQLLHEMSRTMASLTTQKQLPFNHHMRQSDNNIDVCVKGGTKSTSLLKNKSNISI